MQNVNSNNQPSTPNIMFDNTIDLTENYTVPSNNLFVDFFPDISTYIESEGWNISNSE